MDRLKSLTTLKNLYYSITTVSSQADLRILPEVKYESVSQAVKRPQGHQTMAHHLAVPTYMDLFSAIVILSEEAPFTHHTETLVVLETATPSLDL